MLVTALCPTRGRVKMLGESLESLLSKANIRSQVEVLIRADQDDTVTLDWLKANPKLWDDVLVGPRGRGYADLHHMYDDLCAKAKGDFLLMWNDDAMMLTQGWDEEISLRGGTEALPLYLDTRVHNGILEHQYTFPIVHRKYREILGHYSQSAHNDTYIYEVLQPFFPGLYRQTNITISHRFSEVVAANDRTYLEGKQTHSETKRPWKTDAILVPLNEDRAKIAAWLKTNQVP